MLALHFIKGLTYMLFYAPTKDMSGHVFSASTVIIIGSHLYKLESLHITVTKHAPDLATSRPSFIQIITF